LNNPDSHGWIAAPNNTSRPEIINHPDTIQYLNKIDNFKPCRLAPYTGGRVHNLNIQGENYEFLTTELKLYGRIIDFSIWYCYRVSKDGKTTQIFAEKQTMNPIRKSLLFILKYCFYCCCYFLFGIGRAIHTAYYNEVYTGHFETNCYPTKRLTLFHRGYEFYQRNHFSFKCKFGNGCDAKVFIYMIM
jgi:hypothetical protein